VVKCSELALQHPPLQQTATLKIAAVIGRAKHGDIEQLHGIEILQNTIIWSTRLMHPENHELGRGFGGMHHRQFFSK
jgi:hypothetical protein